MLLGWARLRVSKSRRPPPPTPACSSPLRVSDQDRDTAFRALASAQRGAPEHAMLDAQNTLGGGVMSSQLEHIGDLTHRMSEGGGRFGSEFVAPKVNRGIRALASGHGFLDEHRENMAANGVKPEVENAVLQRYVDAHKALPVYNRVQELGRDAAVHLGQKNIPEALSNLHELHDLIHTGAYDAESAKYDPNYEKPAGTQFSPRVKDKGISQPGEGRRQRAPRTVSWRRCASRSRTRRSLPRTKRASLSR